MKTRLSIFLLVSVSTIASSQDIFNRAKASLSSGDTSAAVAGFQEAIRSGQKISDAKYYLGSIALARGKTDEAIRNLSESVDIDDDNVDSRKALGNAYLEKGDVQNALPHFRAATRLAPSDPAIAAAYGTALLEADSVDAAIIRISAANVLNPENPLLYVALGDAYMKQNVTALAITNYQRAKDLDPKSVNARFKLASAFEKEKKWNDAVREYREVQSIDSTRADAYLMEGKIWYKAKQFKNAVAPLRSFVRLKPDSFEGTSMLAESLVEANDPTAVEAARRAVELDSTAAQTWRTYFYALVDNKDFAGAERSLAALQRRGSLEVNDYLKLGALYYGLGREDEALEWYLKAIAVDSTNCDPYFNLGSLYMKRQEYASAAVMFEKKIACDPRSLTASLNAGICYLTIKEYDAARTKLLRVVELKPDYYNGRLWLARYYTQVDSLDQAVAQYDEVLKQVADQPDRKNVAGEAHYLKGTAFFIKQQFDRAIDSFRKASTLGYDNDGLQLMLGQSLLQTLDPKGMPEDNKRKTEDALKAFRRCVALNPNSADGHLWLGETLTRSRIEGENELNRRLTEEACAEYKTALRLDPKNDAARKAIDRIGCP
jgi:tetratricopeptide (TPR) repeat protein